METQKAFCSNLSDMHWSGVGHSGWVAIYSWITMNLNQIWIHRPAIGKYFGISSHGSSLQ